MANEGELSKRIDDLHRRLDDLRVDMGQRFEATDRRIGDLRADLTGRLEEITRRLDTLAAGQQSAFRWMIMTMVALFGIAVPVWMWVLSLILRPLLR